MDNDKTIGLYGFTTLAEFRGLEIGSSLMTFALNSAKSKGYEQVILKASDDAIGIYRGFGFKDQTVYFEYA